MKAFASPYWFRIWVYSLKQRHLLIGTTLNGEQNIDLIFKEVFYVEIPFDFGGVEVVTPTAVDLKLLALSYKGHTSNANYYVLLSGGKRFYIGAADFKIEYHDLSYWQRPR
jgi:hypothetical protein